MTALLFTVGQYALGQYLGKSEVGSSFGVAGSLVILLVWIYYSGQILLFGAEFTAVYANTSGSRIVPSEIAETVSDQSPAAQQATRPAARPSPSAGQPTAQSGGAAARASQQSDRQASEPTQGPAVAHLPPVTLTGHPVGHAAVSEVKGAARELTQQVREAKDQIGGRLRRLLTDPMRVAQERESRRLQS